MLDNYIGERRAVPLHATAEQPAGAEDSPKTNDLQDDAAVHSDVQVQPSEVLEDYTISVEQVRDHFRSKGLPKSKDTIQRWCRTGDLDCRKQGVFGRYFVTETSLLALEQKLLPDMIAEQTGQVLSDAPAKQPDAAVNAAEITGAQVHAPEDEAARTGTLVNEAEDAAARSSVSEPSIANAPDAELAALRAENSGLKEQLADAKDTAAFLREEIVSARGQRGDVVKIAEQMLGTLETMAVGGRLKRAGEQRSDLADAPEAANEPVRYQQVDPQK